MSPLLRGALAGAAATVAMSASMALMRRRLPRRERYPLAPREISTKLLHRSGAPLLSERGEALTALAGHLLYGAMTGALYALAPRRSLSSGLGYGVLVWAASYLGWLPALGLLAPATRHPPRRTALMIAAHLVWGAVLGWLMRFRGEVPAPSPAAAPRASRARPVPEAAVRVEPPRRET